MAFANSFNNMVGGVSSTILQENTAYTLNAGSPLNNMFVDELETTGYSVILPEISTLKSGRQFNVAFNDSEYGGFLRIYDEFNNLLATLTGTSFASFIFSPDETFSLKWAVSVGSSTSLGGLDASVSFSTPGDLSVAYSAFPRIIYSRTGVFVCMTIELDFTPTYTTSSGELIITIPTMPVFGFGPRGYGGTLVATTPIGGGPQTPIAFPSGCTMISPVLTENPQRIRLVGVGSATNSVYLDTTQFTSGVRRYLQMTITANSPG